MLTLMPPALKRYLRSGLLFVGGATIMITTAMLVREENFVDALAVLLFWPVVFYTLTLSVANGMPNPNGAGAWTLRLSVGALCIGFIVAFWVAVPSMSSTFIIALVGVVFATLVELLAPAPFSTDTKPKTKKKRLNSTPEDKQPTSTLGS